MAPKAGKKNIKTGSGPNDWAVAGYDFVLKPYGDHVRIPSSLVGPSLPKYYKRETKF